MKNASLPTLKQSRPSLVPFSSAFYFAALVAFDDLMIIIMIQFFKHLCSGPSLCAPQTFGIRRGPWRSQCSTQTVKNDDRKFHCSLLRAVA